MQKETSAEFKRIEQTIANMETRIRIVVKTNIEELEAEKKVTYTKRMEKLADRLAFISAWIVDYANGRECVPDETSTNKAYLSSTLRRIRRALGYSFTIIPVMAGRLALVFIASMTLVILVKIAIRKIKAWSKQRREHKHWISKLKQVNHHYYKPESGL